MKTLWITLLGTVLFFWSCKEKPENNVPEVQESVQELPKVKRLSPIISELVQFFSDTTLAEGADVNQIIAFKKIDNDDTIVEVDMDEGVSLYKSMMTPKNQEAFPIFEIRNTDTAILPISGKGFGGAIWAKVLIDRNTLEIKKIEFDHKAESEGYGAAMTRSSFENQFAGSVVNMEKNSFVLQKNIEERVDYGTPIDGISGATMTSEGVLDMVNEGLKKYKGYLVSLKK
ncbi:MAG: FMN-binding protein [Pricia sp.]|nr:FMN-binding protein [Pricia sp.]